MICGTKEEECTNHRFQQVQTKDLNRYKSMFLVFSPIVVATVDRLFFGQASPLNQHLVSENSKEIKRNLEFRLFLNYFLTHSLFSL